MENPVLRIGMHLKNLQNGEEYRILHIAGEIAVLCQMNINILSIVNKTILLLLKQMSEDILIEVLEESYVIDVDQLEVKVKEKYLKYKAAMDEVVKVYGPTYINLMGKGSKKELTEIMNIHGLTRTSFWKYLRKYIQSGCNDNALLDARTSNGRYKRSYQSKPGRSKTFNNTPGKLLDDFDIANFDKYIKYYLLNKSATLESAYNSMIADYYREKRINSDGSITYTEKSSEKLPSMRQFTYYYGKQVTPERRDTAKKGAMEQRNNKRLLLGNAKTDVFGPGDIVEIDACELDIALVSREYPEKAVGRPILYLMVDVFTRLILAVSVAMDNNSVVGVTNCLANLVEDKHTLCEKYGITFDNDALWPTNYRPSAIRVDRGSDFISKDIHRFAQEFGIRIDTVPGGTGSMKGVVERIFHNIHDKQNEFLEEKGLITKRHNSKHHKEACLNIDEYTAILLNYVLYHNQHYMKTYVKTSEMIRNDIKPIPAILWEYGCKTLSTPKIIFNKEQFLYGLMIPHKASVTRRGICFEGLYYLNPSDEDMMELMYKQQGKSQKIDIRYDSRDIERIYYLKDGKLQAAILNPAYQEYEGYRGICYKHYKELQKKAKEMDITGEKINRQNRAYLSDVNKAVIDMANKSRYTDTDDIVENRREEKQKISNEHSFSKKLGLSSEETSESIEVKLIDQKIKHKSDIDSILSNRKDIKEAKADNRSQLVQEMLDVMLEDDDD